MKKNPFKEKHMIITLNMPDSLSVIFKNSGGVIEKNKKGFETYNVDRLDPYEFAQSIIQECAEVAHFAESHRADKIYEKILVNFEMAEPHKINDTK